MIPRDADGRSSLSFFRQTVLRLPRQRIRKPSRPQLTPPYELLGKRIGTHQVIDLDLNLIEGSGVILVREIPLHQSMVVNTALDFISQGDAYVFNRASDLWTLSEHFVTVELADVVQINVDG